ncbi:MAG: ATP-binding protein [Polyangiales bacterium]
MSIARILTPPAHSFLLLGARGTGKSTWLSQHFRDAVFFDLLDERLFHRFLQRPHEFAEALGALAPGQWVCVDEIQRLPNLLNEVHRHYERSKLNFALSGSSARKLRRAGVNLLAGRLLSKQMFPFVPQELGADFSLERALSIGTLPIVWTAPEPQETLRSYVSLYLKEEIQAEAIVRDLAGYARFLPTAALMHAQVINVASLARDTGVSRATVDSYLSILEDTLLAFRLPATEDMLRVRQKRHPKLYWIDAGLVRTLRGELTLPLGNSLGALFEGFIANLLRVEASTHRSFETMSYWAAAGSRIEVDFLLHRGPERVAIEVKASDRIRPEHLKGLRALAALEGLRRRVLVYTGDTPRRTEDGIDIWPLDLFLQRLAAQTLFEHESTQSEVRA